jgi:Txe/YoeB family toxin of toxin-antitoxin system
VVSWEVILSKKAVKDAKKLVRAGLRSQAEKLLQLLSEDPLRSPPRFEKLVGDLSGFYSRRISLQHRLIYRVDRARRVVHVLRMWTHYE